MHDAIVMLPLRDAQAPRSEHGARRFGSSIGPKQQFFRSFEAIGEMDDGSCWLWTLCNVDAARRGTDRHCGTTTPGIVQLGKTLKEAIREAALYKVILMRLNFNLTTRPLGDLSQHLECVGTEYEREGRGGRSHF